VDGQDRHLHSNIHSPPQEGNFHDEQRNTIKLDIVVDYNHHMGYEDKRERERMATYYSFSIRHGKWMKQLFSHLLNLAILNSYFLLS
jgi:hypothetical protein